MSQYKIYPSLLDAFVWYQKSESENSEREFIDKINRVPITDEKALERMNNGTALNELVDRYVTGERFEGNNGILTHVIDGKNYTANFSLVKELGEYLSDSLIQPYVEATINVDGNEVLIYGYMDYLDGFKAIDLKSTSSYDLGKYKGSMQRHLYPVCLASDGINVELFEFLVTDFESVFKEPYPVDLEESKAIVSNQCWMLIEFLEAKKHLITDKKIFAQDVELGTV